MYQNYLLDNKYYVKYRENIEKTVATRNVSSVQKKET